MRSALAARLAASDGGASSREGDAQAAGKEGAAAAAGADKADKSTSSPSTLQAQLAAQKASNAALQSELTALKAQLKVCVRWKGERHSVSELSFFLGGGGTPHTSTWRVFLTPRRHPTHLSSARQVATERAGFKSGTLYKYRPWAEGVFADPWARRFISLIGNTLMSYRSEHDVAHLPRSTVTLDEHCTIQV